jgi:predicted RNA-binding Zn ribbon-like protein
VSRVEVGLANEAIDSSAELRRWLEEQGTATSEEISLRLPEFLALRSALRDAFEASIGGGPFPAAAVERLNGLSERVPRVLRFEPPVSVEVPLAGGPSSLVLARIAWSAMELLGGDQRDRLRRCPACGRFFLASRSDRLWCSVACGNRIRVARHQARRTAER